MKPLLTSTILLLTFQFCFSQDIVGTWYMVKSQSLYDIGFNPLQNANSIEPVYRKYYEDSDVKKIMDGAKRK